MYATRAAAKLGFRIVTLVGLMTACLLLAACGRATWWASDESLGRISAEIADRAAANDTTYFSALTADRESVPALIGEIRRSGIATNYADHLVVATADSASLVYDRKAGSAQTVSFIIRLSLVDGAPRVDQIATDVQPSVEPTAIAGKSGEPSAETTPTEFGDVAVSITLPGGRLQAYRLNTAIIGLTNMSERPVEITVPLNGIVRVTDEQDRVVFEGFEPPIQDIDGRQHLLAPLDTVYGVVRFVGPDPGVYAVTAQVSGIWSAPFAVESAY